MIFLNRYSIKVSGRVQGVGFRFSAQYAATTNNLTGWVKNCMDDTVEMEVQGEEEDILRFLKELKRGNSYTKIDDLDINIIPTVENEKGFKIKY